MSAGISRVHGYAFAPSQRPSSIQFFNVSVANVTASEATVVNGAFDQIFRTALDNFATIAMIGSPQTAAGYTTINFAIEQTGLDVNSPSALGQGSVNTNYGTYTTTQAALQGVVQALGSSVGPNSVNLTTATVAFGVAAVSSTSTVYGL